MAPGLRLFWLAFVWSLPAVKSLLGAFSLQFPVPGIDRAILLVGARAHDLVQRAECQPAAGQGRVDGGQPEGHGTTAVAASLAVPLTPLEEVLGTPAAAA